MVLVPESDVLFAGALCCFGVTPLAFDGDPGAWADTLDELADLATTIVPGHGPVGGADEVRALQGYLRACAGAGGDPARIGPGPWDDWVGREWDVVNVERAAGLAAGDLGAAAVPAASRRPGLTGVELGGRRVAGQRVVTARRTARSTTVNPSRPAPGSASTSRRNAAASATASAARPR